MEITGFKQTDIDSIQFIWNNPKQHIIHALQRSIISDVPTLCIDMVMVDENTSMLADQELALRLGLLPIESKFANEFLMPDECDCENFCNKCSVKMTLNVACYGDRYDVTSKDLRCDPGYVTARPVHESSLPKKYLGNDGFGPGILLVTLIRNQTIRLSCIVRKGTGKIHGKWNPTSKITFVPMPVVNINMKKFKKLNQTMEKKLRQDIENDLRTKYEPKCKKYLEPIIKKEVEESNESGELNQELYKTLLSERTLAMINSIVAEHLEQSVQKNKIDWQKKLLDSCPRGVFKDLKNLEDVDEKWWSPANNNSYMVCNACIRESEDVLEVDNLITVGNDEKNFICKMAGTGVLSPKEILLRSIQQLRVRFVGLEMEMANLLNNVTENGENGENNEMDCSD